VNDKSKEFGDILKFLIGTSSDWQSQVIFKEFLTDWYNEVMLPEKVQKCYFHVSNFAFGGSSFSWTPFLILRAPLLNRDLFWKFCSLFWPQRARENLIAYRILICLGMSCSFNASIYFKTCKSEAAPSKAVFGWSFLAIIPKTLKQGIAFNDSFDVFLW